MKWAVEAKVFGDGRIVARVRPAREDEEFQSTLPKRRATVSFS